MSSKRKTEILNIKPLCNPQSRINPLVNKLEYKDYNLDPPSLDYPLYLDPPSPSYQQASPSLPLMRFHLNKCIWTHFVVCANQYCWSADRHFPIADRHFELGIVLRRVLDFYSWWWCEKIVSESHSPHVP